MAGNHVLVTAETEGVILANVPFFNVHDFFASYEQGNRKFSAPKFLTERLLSQKQHG